MLGAAIQYIFVILFFPLLICFFLIVNFEKRPDGFEVKIDPYSMIVTYNKKDGLVWDVLDPNELAIDPTTGSSIPPLLAAVERGDLSAVYSLTEDEEFAEHPEQMEGAMFAAVIEGRTDMLKVFLDAGVDPNAINSSGESILSVAARFGRHNSVRALLQAGADPRWKDPTGKTALKRLLEERIYISKLLEEAFEATR